MSVASRYLENLRAGLRLALFLPVRPEAIHASGPMVVLLFATAVLLHLVKDLSLVGFDGSFTPFGLQGILFYVPLLLLAAALIAWIAREPVETVRLATAFSALLLPILVVELATWNLLWRPSEDRSWMRWVPWRVLQWTFPLWLALALAVASLYLLRLAPAGRAATIVIAGLVVALPLGSIYRERTLWMKPYDENAAAERRQFAAAASEDAFYQQPKVLARTLQAIEPGRKGAIDLYYVGIGGYARQDVFLREIRAVEQMMQGQFDAKGRSASLLNNPQTLMELPIASATSLQATLTRIGEIMDREDDILFLFMTSHGSKDHKFTLELWPLQFNDLTPVVVRKSLDDAGIQWRVIVISACYAGGFIDALKDERSIVIAAAAPEKQSFGCSHEAEWTYFSKAFFDESLRIQPRLTEAFALARKAVEVREKQEQVEPHSDPQMAAGKAMEKKWDEYLAQRAKRGQR